MVFLILIHHNETLIGKARDLDHFQPDKIDSPILVLISWYIDKYDDIKMTRLDGVKPSGFFKDTERQCLDFGLPIHKI